MFISLLFSLIGILIGIFLIVLYFKKYDKNKEKIAKGVILLLIGVILVSWKSISFLDEFLEHKDGCCRCYEYIGSNGYSPQVCCTCAWPFSYK